MTELLQPPQHQNRITPNTEPKTETTPDAQTGRALSRRKFLLLGGGALATGLGVAIGINALSSDKPAASGTDTTVKNPPVDTDPSAPANPEDPAAIRSAHEIKEGLGNQEFAEKYMTGITDWMNFGATPEFADKWLTADGKEATDKLVSDITSQAAEIFAGALFVEGYEKHPDIADYVKFYTDFHASTLDLYAKTSNPDVYPDDKEPFRRWNEVTTADLGKASSHGRSGVVTFIEHNNADQNRVGEDDPKVLAANGGEVQIRMTTKIEDGREKIAAIRTLPNK